MNVEQEDFCASLRKTELKTREQLDKWKEVRRTAWKTCKVSAKFMDEKEVAACKDMIADMKEIESTFESLEVVSLKQYKEECLDR